MKKILITRTDRIGDVLLSTPVFRAVREKYPESYIAVIVRPYAKDIVEGNPYIDEVIIYDKYGVHKSFFGSLKFSLNLAKQKFNIAIILHPTNRMHLITFFTGIPERVGFYKKCGFLLTRRIPHTKQLGQKHELDYTLDVVRAIGIEPTQKLLFFPLRRDIDLKIKNALREKDVEDTDKLVIVHPAASCVSKRWPSACFAKLADELIKKYGVKIVVISSKEGKTYARDMLNRMHYEAIDFSGETTVSEIGSLIKRSELLVSNDSGPVHIAVALGTPVISIFGRKDAGLSPVRWRPLGARDIVFHKSVGCLSCMAHNCNNYFKCLSAITTEEVLEASGRFLSKIKEPELQKGGLR